MRELLKIVLSKVATNEFTWRVFSKLIYPAVYYVSEVRAKKQRLASSTESFKSLSKKLKRFSSDQSVLHGPFKGMVYPTFESVGSTLAPKILGCYEMELSQTLQSFFKNDYTHIVDIGCAEGYYAVGLAMRFSNTKVYAFDVDDSARALCESMAAVNGVADRLEIGGNCDSIALERIVKSGSALIICDCEGYEKELFSSVDISLLARHDLIVETHDFLDITISEVLKARFEETHDIESIYSIDDLEKVESYDFPELLGSSRQEKYEILAELRPGRMEWLCLRAKR